MNMRRFQRALVVHALHAREIFAQQGVGGSLDLAGDVAIGGAAVRRVVFEAAILGRVVRGRDHDAVGEAARSPLVVGKNRVGDDGRRRVAELFVGHDLDAIGGENLQSAGEGREGQRVRINADEQRAVDPVTLAIPTDRLTDGDDVGFIE